MAIGLNGRPATGEIRWKQLLAGRANCARKAARQAAEKEYEMSWQPLLEAPLVIQIHAFGAMAAFLLGVVQIAAPKGTLPHKTIGALWLVIMLVIAVSSIFVRPSLFPGLPITQWFSWIHLFTLLTFYAVAQGLFLLMRGGPALKFHSRPFIGLFIGGLIVAGVLAFLPGRIMHKVVFGA